MTAVGIFDEDGTGGVFGAGLSPQGSSPLRGNDCVLQGDDIQQASREVGDLSEPVVVVLDEPIDDPARQSKKMVDHFEGVVLLVVRNERKLSKADQTPATPHSHDQWG